MRFLQINSWPMLRFGPQTNPRFFPPSEPIILIHGLSIHLFFVLSLLTLTNDFMLYNQPLYENALQNTSPLKCVISLGNFLISSREALGESQKYICLNQQHFCKQRLQSKCQGDCYHPQTDLGVGKNCHRWTWFLNPSFQIYSEDW